MAKYIEVIAGEHKGLICYVRESKDPESYETFEKVLIKKSDCRDVDFEKVRISDPNPGCRYR